MRSRWDTAWHGASALQPPGRSVTWWCSSTPSSLVTTRPSPSSQPCSTGHRAGFATAMLDAAARTVLSRRISKAHIHDLTSLSFGRAVPHLLTLTISRLPRHHIFVIVRLITHFHALSHQVTRRRKLITHFHAVSHLTRRRTHLSALFERNQQHNNDTRNDSRRKAPGGVSLKGTWMSVSKRTIIPLPQKMKQVKSTGSLKGRCPSRYSAVLCWIGCCQGFRAHAIERAHRRDKAWSPVLRSQLIAG